MLGASQWDIALYYNRPPEVGAFTVNRGALLMEFYISALINYYLMYSHKHRSNKRYRALQ